MKRIIIGAMAAAALLACSKDQVIEQNRANDEIAFSVVADNQTKAAAVYCANKLLPEFNVAATYTKTGETTAQWYFQNDNIAFESSAWVNKTTTRYWADGGTLDFYAIYNGTMNLTAVGKTPDLPTVDFTPAVSVADQKDLLYAVATGKTKTTDAVALNFRHALSQIEFRARNTNAQLHVVIEDVQVGHTPSTGTFTYPAGATDVNFENHDQDAAASPALNTGSWAVGEATADYTASFNPVTVAGNNENVGLTLSSDKDNVTNSMLLIPATTTAWTPAASQDDFDGTYLAVNCKIYNVAGTSYVEGDICLHEGWAVMPVAFAWEPGKKYIYTFVFGKGNGGYDGGDPDPDPDPDPENPTPSDDPVLVPISYEVTVDDFQKGIDSDVTMQY